MHLIVLLQLLSNRGYYHRLINKRWRAGSTTGYNRPLGITDLLLEGELAELCSAVVESPSYFSLELSLPWGGTSYGEKHNAYLISKKGIWMKPHLENASYKLASEALQRISQG